MGDNYRKCGTCGEYGFFEMSFANHKCGIEFLLICEEEFPGLAEPGELDWLDGVIEHVFGFDAEEAAEKHLEERNNLGDFIESEKYAMFGEDGCPVFYEARAQPSVEYSASECEPPND